MNGDTPPADRSGEPSERIPSFRIDLPGVEGFRAVAALSVLMFHAHLALWWQTGRAGRGSGVRSVTDTWLDQVLVFGHLGVVLFFVISGLVLFLPFAQRLLAGRPAPDIGRYATRRLLRIYPAYIAVLGIAALVFGFRLYGQDDANIVVFAANLLLLQAYHVSIPNILGVAWTLPVELGFYALLPLLAGIARWRVRVRGADPWRALWLVVGGAMALTLGLRWLRMFSDWDLRLGFVSLERTILIHLDSFAVGMALALVYLAVLSGKLRIPAWLRPGTVSLLALAPLAIGTLAAVAWKGPWGSAFDYACAIGFGMLLARVLLWPERGLAPRLVRNRAMEWMGLVSYSIYLWHTVVLRVLREAELMPGTDGLLNLGIVIFACVALTLVASAGTYYGIERVYMRSRPRRQVELAAGSNRGDGVSEAADPPPHVATRAAADARRSTHVNA